MPLYEYQCSDCSTRFEILQRLGAGSKGLDCPQCGSTVLEKLFSTFASASSSSSTPRTTGDGGSACGTGFT